MLNRYIGNKKSILKPIMEQIQNLVPQGGAVCDAFSGSVAVAFELKKYGYKVACNDINLFSNFYAKHLIEQCTLPDIEIEKFGFSNLDYLTTCTVDFIDKNLIGVEGYAFLNSTQNRSKYKNLAILISYLNMQMTIIPLTSQHSLFYDTYTEDGARSSFVSQRGSIGKRRFFTPSNGTRLDVVMSIIRDWFKRGLLSEGYLYYTLICSVVDAVEKVSNTQGTYHDFPRNTYDSRAFLELTLAYPSFDGILNEKLEHQVGKSQDSINFVKNIDEQDLLYLDPPYNFRQYTSYYFLPNVICKYCELEDPEAYFNAVKYVRGQNMEDDFASTFSKKNEFITSLTELVNNCNTKFVLMSYFDGRNHWNNTVNGSDHKGKEVILEFFNSELFRKNKSTLIPFERLNYQSYGGHKAKYINEFLFLGEKT